MDKNESSRSSFNINTNDGTINYTTKGHEKLSKDDSIMLKTNDPLGNNIILWENTFQYHILGEPDSSDSRHFLDTSRNIQRIETAINIPNYILEDKKYEDRLEYIALTDIITNGENRLKNLSIITEKSDSVENSFEIITVIPKSRVSVSLNDRRVVYNVNDNTDRT